MSRGTTRPGRLRLLDEALLAWLERVPRPVVEIGVGARPDTVVEWFARVGGGVALDHDPVRVERACAAGLDARLGSFDLGFEAGLVRAVNVLRELRWPEEPVQQVRLWLGPEGLFVDATTDKPGFVAAARLLDRERERGWLFAWDGRHGFHPRMFRGQVPRGRREVLERFDAGKPLPVPTGGALFVPPH